MITEQIQRFINNQEEQDLFSGSVLVIKDEKLIVDYSCGFANLEKNILNTPKTIFNIGSMDKMFTGVAIAKLAQEGKLDLQDRIIKYLPDYPKDIANKVTIHHILTHTEGFGSYFNKKYIQQRLHLKSIEDYLDLFKDDPLLFEPGEKYQYSNSGYVVLGTIIEAITRRSYYDYVKEIIFDKAIMPNTGSFSLERDDLAHGYTFRKPFSQESTLEVRRDNIDELPYRGSSAGGGYSTCPDLINFSKALLNNQLLSPEMTKVVLTPKEKVGSKDNTTLYYGYGFQVLDVGDGDYRYGHAGAFAGVNARLDMYPWLGYTVVVLSNYDQPAAFTVANEIGEFILAF